MKELKIAPIGYWLNNGITSPEEAFLHASGFVIELQKVGLRSSNSKRSRSTNLYSFGVNHNETVTIRPYVHY
jgi:hypothetical protein